MSKDAKSVRITRVHYNARTAFLEVELSNGEVLQGEKVHRCPDIHAGKRLPDDVRERLSVTKPVA